MYLAHGILIVSSFIHLLQLLNSGQGQGLCLLYLCTPRVQNWAFPRVEVE